MGQGSSASLRLRLLCPAKINLHLRVGPRRDDGFHPLLTWMCTVGLFDSLTLSSGARDVGEVEAVLLETDSPDLPREQGNLVVRVADAWRAQALASGIAGGALAPEGDVGGQVGGARSRRREGHGFFPVRAVLGKRIPVGAGLGGGSSDAARTLLGLERLRREWLKAGAAAGRGAPGSAVGTGTGAGGESRRPANDLSAFAGRFGSDVPFFVHAAFPPPEGGPSAVCTERGEVVTPVGAPAARWAVLVLPGVALATADVYRRFDEMGLGREQDVAEDAAPNWREWSALPAADLLPRLVNDLEPAAFSLRPDLAELQAAARAALGRTVRMSGSGSSLFTLFDARADAEAAAATVTQRLAVRAEAVELAPAIEDDLVFNEAGQGL